MFYDHPNAFCQLRWITEEPDIAFPLLQHVFFYTTLQNFLPLSNQLVFFFLFLFALSIPLSLSPIEVLSCHGVRARCVMTHCGELVELSEELVEQLHQLLSCALWRQAGEAHDVCKQDAAGTKREREKRDKAKVPEHHCIFPWNSQYHKTLIASKTGRRNGMTRDWAWEIWSVFHERFSAYWWNVQSDVPNRI